MSIETNPRNPDEAQLRADIFAMRQQGMSCRQIAWEVGLRWTRVQQIVNGKNTR